MSTGGKLLTVMCQGRNDSYMGDFKWRLSTVLNKLSRDLAILGAMDEVEVLVADWGSEVLLVRDLDLSREARRLVEFLIVPPEVAQRYDRDAGFSSVHPINAVARRARGQYLMFSDSDVYIPLDSMAKLLAGLRAGRFGGLSLEDSFFWSSKRHIPLIFISAAPTLEEIDAHVESAWPTFAHEQVNRQRFLGCGVCLLMRRATWHASRGWDERMIYWGWNDIDLHRRLETRYQWEDLERLGIKIFHLEHYTSAKRSRSENPRKANPQVEPTTFAPNPASWGLRDHRLEIVDGYGRPTNDPLSALESVSPRLGVQTVAQIVATSSLFGDVVGRFPFDPRGFFTNAEALGRLLDGLRPSTICEIGSWMGASARFFAARPSTSSVFCVDPWDRDSIEDWVPGEHPERLMNNMYEQFLANCVHAGAADKIVPLRASSVEAADYLRREEPDLRFDLIYVDGQHRTAGVRLDLLTWLPFLAPRGVMCGDDWLWQKDPNNVARAVRDVAISGGMHVFSEGNLWVLLGAEAPQIALVRQFMNTAHAPAALTPSPAAPRRLAGRAAGVM